MIHHSSISLFPALDEGFIRRIQKARSARATFLKRDLFADPAWVMLLELYACELGHKRVDVSSLCVASNVPATTALRWIRQLEQDSLARRENDPSDCRRQWVKLTPTGSSALRRYFATISSAPISI